jgi:hypothetical protein
MWDKILKTIKNIETPKIPTATSSNGNFKPEIQSTGKILIEVLDRYCSIDEIQPVNGQNSFFRVTYIRENFCPLKEYIRLKNNIVITRKIPFGNDLLMKVGEFLHDYLRKIFLSSQIHLEKIDEEFKDPEYWLRGHPDGIATINNTRYLLEIKTTSSLPTTIPMNYLLQTSLYKHLLKANGIEIDKILFLFVQYMIDRSAPQIKPKIVEIVVNPIDISSILSRLKEYISCVQEDKFPQGICQKNNPLRYCEVIEQCPAIKS